MASAVVEPNLNEEPRVDDAADIEDDESDGGLRFSIASYGADYPVDALVKRLKSQAIEVPRFQRGFVWTLPQSSRFIESLLLGLPVPAVFLSKHAESQRLLVIDGQQRLTSLKYFYEGVFRGGAIGKEFQLRGVSRDLEGKTYDTLSEEDRRRLDDSLLHAIIVNQVDPQDDQTGLYSIFERINTGGTPLQPQEIRACIYEGSFIKLLKELAANSDWVSLYGAASTRAKDQEMILRFLALHFVGDKYEPPMKHFLNRFVASNRELEPFNEAAIKKAFEPVVKLANAHIGPKAFRPVRNLNAALLDCVLVGLAWRLDKGPVTRPEELGPALDGIMKSPQFIDAYTSGTTGEAKVKKRIELASEAFGSVP
ncbi:MAG TPA: DUF262 domain-containing protein [Gemmatales bacterium]|nr:DUF262 domain-containing protein [Gemmatales bacterium]HMP59067.1 DUF262 domain-containing protein [Gemmatales bacterium]